MEWLGFDPDAPTPNDITMEQVDLEDIPAPFNNEELLQLREMAKRNGCSTRFK